MEKFKQFLLDLLISIKAGIYETIDTSTKGCKFLEEHLTAAMAFSIVMSYLASCLVVAIFIFGFCQLASLPMMQLREVGIVGFIIWIMAMVEIGSVRVIFPKGEK